ncbi:MAG: MCE family protein [Verrucomicrobia bacterium]|nr:MCE family protein [Verrucomicrobiota bacterium]
MAVQDLTPQLRTRLSRVERAVGWFVILATILLVAGFAYYVHHTAKRKGWFLRKIPYHTYVRDATGLKIGDPVRLMGFEVGEITRVDGMPAGKNWFSDNNYNVFVQFVIREPYFGYVWSDSKVRIGAGDFLGKRALEVVKGITGEVTVVEGKQFMVMNKDRSKTNDYVLLEKQPQGWWLPAEESPALGERLEQIANRVEHALPTVLALTNQLTGILSNSTKLLTQLNGTVGRTEPVLSNLTLITGFLNNSQGALGEWLIPTNLNRQIESTLAAATSTLTTADTNLAALAVNLNRTLENLANVTSNLNAQVQTNDQILNQISSAIVHADEMVQGLKRHWLLRSAFKEKRTNQPPSRLPLTSPKAAARR